MQGFHVVFLEKNMLPSKYHLLLSMCWGFGDELRARRTALPWTISSRALEADSSRMIGGWLFLAKLSPDNWGEWLLPDGLVALYSFFLNIQKEAVSENSWNRQPAPSHFHTFYCETCLFPSRLLSSLLVVFCRHFPQMTLLEPQWNWRHCPCSTLRPLTTQCFQSVERVFSSLSHSLCSLASHSDSRICLIWEKLCTCYEWLLLLTICPLEPVAAQCK